MNRVLLGAVALLTLAACGGSTGPAGPQGAQGDPGPAGPAGSNGTTTASVSGVTPDHVFLARNAEVTISGFGTNWSAASTVDFGAGITVKKLTVASPTALVADITIDKAAAMGPRDVTVNDAGGKTTYTNGFKVISPISLTFQGTLAQGSILLAHVKDLDVDNPFDTTSTVDPNTLQTVFTNLALTLPKGVTGFVTNATDFGVDLQLETDVSAMGKQDFDLVSGPANDPTDLEFPLPQGLDVAARMPTALMNGTPATGSTATPFASQLFSYTPASASLSIVDFSANSATSGANPLISLLPKSGAWADWLNVGWPTSTWLTSSTDVMYAVYIDGSGGTGTYSVGVTATAPAGTAAASANDGSKTGAAAATALPFVLTGGNLANNSDWVQVTVAQADTGKSLWVQTIGDYLTDAAVTVYQADGATMVGQPAETGTLVDSTFGPLSTAGNYYVVFAPGQSPDPMHGTYQGVIRLK